MIATIQPTTYGTGGLEFNLAPSSQITETAVRVSRTPTLDGGAHINHMGFSKGDRRLVYIAVLDVEQLALLETLIANETEFTTSSPAGFFHGVIESIGETDEGVEIVFLAGA